MSWAIRKILYRQWNIYTNFKLRLINNCFRHGPRNFRICSNVKQRTLCFMETGKARHRKQTISHQSYNKTHIKNQWFSVTGWSGSYVDYDLLIKISLEVPHLQSPFCWVLCTQQTFYSTRVDPLIGMKMLRLRALRWPKFNKNHSTDHPQPYENLSFEDWLKIVFYDDLASIDVWLLFMLS